MTILGNLFPRKKNVFKTTPTVPFTATALAIILIAGWVLWLLWAALMPPAVSLSLAPGQPLRDLPLMKNEATTNPNQHFEGRLMASNEAVEVTPQSIWQKLLPRNPHFMLYNKSIPGPLVEVMGGTEVTIPFTNKLAEITTVHFHGLSTPVEQDGNPEDIVAPNKTRPYHFTLPADWQGTFWYHPHPMGLSAKQLFYGLAGPMIVHAKDDPLAALHIPEHNLFITGIRLKNGRVDPNTDADWNHGRMGETLLVNGQVVPVLTVAPNSTHRLRIWNATNGRFISLSIKKDDPTKNVTLPLYLVGTDGGLIEHPYRLNEEPMLAAAERQELVATFNGKAGDIFTLYQQYPILPEEAVNSSVGNATTAGEAINQSNMKMVETNKKDMEAMGHTMAGDGRDNSKAMKDDNMNMEGMDGMEGMGDDKDKANKKPMGGDNMNMASKGDGNMGGMNMETGIRKPLMVIKLEGAATKPTALPDRLRTIAALPAPSGPVAHKKLNLTGVLSNVSINGRPFDMNRIDYTSKKGAVEEWTITNQSDMTHPLHIHGGQFQVVRATDSNGRDITPPYRAWRDTVSVAPGEILIFRMKQEFVGRRMIHCHILEHEDKGMMTVINVIP